MDKNIINSMKHPPIRAERYKRHLSLEHFGKEGQRKIAGARVLVIGAGGLGSPALLYLAAAGVRTIGIADKDVVDISNLQRQVIYTTADIGKNKAEMGAIRVHELNPDVTPIVHAHSITPANIRPVIEAYDFVIDGTDTFDAKFFINDACVAKGIPYVHAGVVAYEGQVMTVLPGQSACYRCIFKKPPDQNLNAPEHLGTFGPVPGIIGGIQATEALKFITGIGDLLSNRLLTYNALSMMFRTIPLKKQPRCSACGA